MIAYNNTWLFNLTVVKEAKRWLDEKIISENSFRAIKENHPSQFYHPNLFIRILLFLATLVALAGVTGFLGLLFAEAFSSAIEVLCILYGIGSWIFLEKFFIGNGKHYKSGVNEAMLYHSLGWTIGGISALAEFDETFFLVVSLILLTFAAIRYADLVCTALAFGFLGYIIFDGFYSMGGIFTQIIPIVFLVIFTPAYFLVSRVRRKPTSELWDDCLIVLESLTLITIYAAGNYFVVRELSESLLSIYLEPGQDIPFAWIFYILTITIPVIYLYFGITRKDMLMLRVSLIAIGFSAFTFKYYFSFGHPEVTLTLGGAILLTVSFALFRYLRVSRNGFIREQLLKEKWAGANPEAFIISQTLGGNKIGGDTSPEMGGGGEFGGGGSSDSF